MRLAITLQRSPKQEKALVVLRAIYNAEPGKEKRAVKRALKKYRKARRKAA